MRALVLACLIACGDDVTVTPDELPPEVQVTIAAPGAPSALIAFRAGDEAWQTDTGAASPITFKVRDQYTVAVRCERTNTDVVYELTVAETTSLESDVRCPQASVPVLISGTITAPNLDYVELDWGPFKTKLDVTTNPMPFSLAAEAGTHDLVAVGLTRGPGGAYFTNAQVVHGFEALADTTIDADLSTSTSALPIGMLARTVGNLLITGDGTHQFLSRTNFGDPSSSSFPYMPEAARAPDDRQVLTFYLATQDVLVEHIAPSTNLGTITPPVERPLIYNTYATWNPHPGAAAYAIRAGDHTIFVSPAVFEKASTLAVPDLSTIPDWGFNQTGGWSFTAIQSSAPLADAIRVVPRSETLYFSYQ
ncbi:MAG TPA: hypothetical protein VL326_30045 [Kofleriaceae bacterium]|nr:hypothetical protein [Kofleriaceae bacterium]